MKLSPEQHDLMLSIIKEDGLNNISYTKTRDKVFDATGVLFDSRSIAYWNKKVFHYKFIEKLKQDNLIMSKWRKEYIDDDHLTTNELQLNEMYAKAKHYFEDLGNEQKTTN